MIKKLSAALLLLFVLLPAQGSGSGEIKVTVTVEGFKNDKGLCRLLVYENEKGFPGDADRAVLKSSLEIKNRKTEFTFMIPAGTYAISILHDENSNEKIDKTWYGKPKEGLGVSNNPRVSFGPPKFVDAAVEIDRQNAAFLIKLIYL